MAKQGENREEIQGTKRLYRVWSQVDSKIELPSGLAAHSLLPRLDHVEQPVAPIGKIRFSPKIFTWQFGVTYAAAFALILMLSSVLTRGGDRQQVELLHGEIAAAPAITEDAGAVAEAGAIAADAIVTEAATEPAPVEEPIAVEQEADVFAAQLPEGRAAIPVFEEPGIGGQSESILLGTDETYTYLWRVNDPTDPDKAGYPVTVNIVDTASEELAAVIDLPDMLAVEDYYLYNDIIVFAGSGENSAVLYALDITDKGNPLPYLDVSQPGVYADSSLNNNTLHLLTVAETADGLDCEIVALPGSDSTACCVVTALDLTTREVFSKGFSGVSNGEISLYNLHANISYDGAVTEENAAGKYTAQIRLDGMSIELEDAPEQEATEPPEVQTEPTETASEATEATEEPSPPAGEGE